jgi:branched-chain amino acid transport system ATP-binding protein
MLEISGLDVHIGSAHILHDVALTLPDAPLALVGRNGMGKTTLCYAVAGMRRASRGSIRLGGVELAGRPAHRVAQAGIALVPQGRRCFPSLTVDEHLRLVARGRGAAWTIERVYETFPRLAERRRNGGTQLSGGEQQMLAIGRALLTEPRLLILDEPSEGLAPVIVEHLCRQLAQLGAAGLGILLVEQKLAIAAAVCAEVAVMLNGRIAARMPMQTLRDDPVLQGQFLGIARHAA